MTFYLTRNSPFAGFRAQVAKNKVEDEDEVDDPAEKDENEDGDEGEDEDGKKKKSKKTKKAEDDADEKDEDKPEARAARSREKARINEIMNSAAGKRFPAAALSIAFNTTLPRHAAIRTLNAMTADLSPGPASNADRLRNRMAGLNTPNIGPGDGEAPSLDSPAAVAAAIIRAGEKRRGEIVD